MKTQNFYDPFVEFCETVSRDQNWSCSHHDTTRRISLHRGGTKGIKPRVLSPPPVTATSPKTYPRPKNGPLTQIPPGGGRRAPLPGGVGAASSGPSADSASDPSPRPARRRPTPRGLEAGDAPQPKKKELAALQKSWTNFSGDDGCGRGEWDWGIAPTPPAPRSWNVRSEAAERPPTPRFPPPRGQDA